MRNHGRKNRRSVVTNKQLYCSSVVHFRNTRARDGAFGSVRTHPRGEVKWSEQNATLISIKGAAVRAVILTIPCPVPQVTTHYLCLLFLQKRLRFACIKHRQLTFLSVHVASGTLCRINMAFTPSSIICYYTLCASTFVVPSSGVQVTPPDLSVSRLYATHTSVRKRKIVSEV